MDYTSLKYIIAVANNHSISKAAEKLFVSQPNISKAIQNIEKEVGFSIFIRTSKGVEPTIEGKELIIKANSLLNEFDDFSNEYTNKSSHNLNFSISYPRATYIASAVTKYINNHQDKDSLAINLYEANSSDTIFNIVKGVCNIGIIRSNISDLSFYKNLLKQNNLDSQILYEFRMVAIMSNNHPLAKNTFVTKEDLLEYVSIIHANPEIVDTMFVKNNFYYGKKNIRVYERGTQMTCLEYIKDSYMMVSPMPKEYLEKFNYATVVYESPSNYWQDLVIFKQNHRLSRLEREIINSIQDTIKNSIY